MNKKDIKKLSTQQIKRLLACSKGQAYKVLMIEYAERN
ncbi:hypothetical protein MBGDF03_00699 [Thermoplasmatales archaeon SCGC AB-540-F20]|nr:hypothetical protein MBGDF03_00699 [Thermoplasmatales archaeon SCGC AB-540-F20]